ncbi:MAG TPA: hypothetical protein PKW98_01520 [Candidatus Wallbacteria bacterium]|nr:MAG: hypothetical protein BWY32_00583 [bacterium ADurb.Bin243]HOD42097.1 hypothetical protein [Candidatus Wallbacteria bacterium]HPG56470.1 hypothetical protein [Candidatus Wallbacteria bacterium]
MSGKNRSDSTLTARRHRLETLISSYDKHSNENIFSKILHYSQFNYCINLF